MFQMLREQNQSQESEVSVAAVRALAKYGVFYTIVKGYCWCGVL